jgi:HSP20 family protein
MIKKSSLILGLGLLMAGIFNPAQGFIDPFGRRHQGIFDDAFWHELEQGLENRWASLGSSASIKEDKITLSYDIPGLSKKEISVNVESGNRLVIKGSKQEKIDEKEKGKEAHYRSVRSIYKEMILPQNADVAKISAEVENGVLTVVIPRKPLPPQITHKITVK